MEAPKKHSTVNAELAKEAYGQHRNESPIIKRAYALAALFKKMPIYIRDGELLAGNRSAGIGVMPKIPDEWNFRENMRTRADDARYEAMALYDNFSAKLSPEIIRAQNCLLAGYPAGSGDGFGHILADYGMIIGEGALELAAKAEKQAAFFESREKSRERDFCRASAIACRAFSDFGLRYRDLALEEAGKCADEKRKSELLDIAEVCGQTPSYGARNFREAIQAMYFTHMAMLLEQHGGSISIGRFDRILWPYYKNDIEKGTITADFAAELVESFCIKVMENAIWPREIVMFANCAIGGCDEEGKDASNDLTWMMLDCIAKTGSPHPMVSFRWHPAIPRELWLRVVEIIGLGYGLPAIFSDPKMMKVLETWGVPPEIASGYGIVGCVEPGLNGLLHGQTMGGHINLALCLELAMNNGRRFEAADDSVDAKIGPETGYLYNFSDVEELWEAYEKQLVYACEINRQAVCAVAQSQKELYGYPLMSSLMKDAVELGRDLTYGAKWNYDTVCITGATNVADSFAILEELADKRKKYGYKTFYNALVRNYFGYELLRAEIRNQDYCFGNQNPVSIEWHRRVSAAHTGIFKTQAAPRGGAFAPGLWTTTWHVNQGRHTGASLDGRLAGEPLADSVGPLTHRIMHGPTAAASDVAGIDCIEHWPGGYVWNARFSKDLFSPASLNRIAGFISTYFQLGGMQIQINTYSSDLLRQAQKDPHQYRDLVVRVAGFSAYFCALSKDVQNEIIARSELAV